MQNYQSHTLISDQNFRIYIIPNFLPNDLAERWRDELKNTWDRTIDAMKENDSSMKKDDDGSPSIFSYATNNQGDILDKSNINAKYRSLKKIHERKNIANEMYESDLFSYAKWELHASHPLVKEAENYMSSEATRERVQNIIRDQQQQQPPSHRNKVNLSSELSDLFVTYYGTGDFLSPHDDGHSGSYAFVISLMDGGGEWNAEKFGGELRFQCEEEEQKKNSPHQSFSGWCKSIKPSFNSLILIQTRVIDGTTGNNMIPGPLHEVLSVNEAAELDGFYRFGITGWYQNDVDMMSDRDRLERDKMRARD